MLKFETSDNKIVEVDKNLMLMWSVVLNRMCGLIDDRGEAIPLQSIRADILNRVVAWAEFHKNDPEPTEKTTEFGHTASELEKPLDERLANINEWDKKFVDVDLHTIYELIQAANFLDIQKLLDLLTLTMSGILKGKSAEELRETFGLPDDLPKEVKK